MKHIGPKGIVIVLSLVFAGWSAPALAKTPKTVLKQTNDKINRLLRKKATPGSATDRKIRLKLKKEINAFLDFHELAKRSLRQHWDERTPQEQQEFVDLLRDLIETNYIKQLRGNLDYKLHYRQETVNGDKAEITTAVKVDKNGRTDEVIIQYKMLRVKNHWMVYDVITDDVSILRNYRSQFNRIIKRKSYQHLVKKMRRKLEQTKNT